jgi:hypothetical protein
MYCSNKLVNGSKLLVFRTCQILELQVRDCGVVLTEQLLSVLTLMMKMKAGCPSKTVATQYPDPNSR